MRKLTAVAALAIAVAVAVTAGSAHATPPTRTVTANGSFVLDAGTACTFPLQGDVLVDQEITTTFAPRPNGDEVSITTGHLVYRFSNPESGKSIVRNISGSAMEIEHADGTEVDIFDGPTLLFFGPNDIPAGPTAFINYGHATVLGAEDAEQFVLTERTGAMEDICAELA
jgi:hypothetical protein